MELLNQDPQRYLTTDSRDPYEMGFVQGIKLLRQIKSMKRMIKFCSFSKGVTYSRFKKIASRYEPFISYEELLEIEGIAAGTRYMGSNLSVPDILAQKCFVDVYYGQLISFHRTFNVGCTSIGAYNGGCPVVGQNFDYTPMFRNTMSFLLRKGDISTFNLKLGAADIPCGKNSKGLVIVSNVVRNRNMYPIHTPASILFMRLLSKENVNDFLDEHSLNRQTLGYNLMATDGDNLYSGQFSSEGSKIIRNPPIAVNTNTYIHRDWQSLLLRPWYSKERQEVVESAVLACTDAITEGDILRILMTSPEVTRRKVFKSSTLAVLTPNKFGMVGSWISDTPI